MKICLACEMRFDDPVWRCPDCAFTPILEDGFRLFAPGLASSNNSFDQEYFAQLESVERTSFWFIARNELITWALRTYFPEARNMLEIGCGTGFVLSGVQETLPHLALMGSEIFINGLRSAKQRVPDAELCQMDARHIPFEREFDVIGAFDVLEHIEEDDLVLRQLFQACNPGGGILLTVPQHMSLWSVLDEYSYHKRRYARKELIRQVKAAGFTILRATSFVSLLLPIMWWSRKRMTGSAEDLNPLSEFQISKTTQWILHKIMRVERWLIRVGVSLPAGGSLLVIAKR